MVARAQRRPTRHVAVLIAALTALGVVALPVSSPTPASAAVVGDGRTMATAAGSCWAAKQAVPTATNGIYWLQTPVMPAPDQFYCDMTTDGGGWVMIARGREGWRFDELGQGSPADLRSVVTGPGAYPPAALPSATIDQLLGNAPVTSLVDGVRIVRAKAKTGTSTHTITWRFRDLKSWSWAFDGGHRLASVTIGTVTTTGSNTRDSKLTVWGEVGTGTRTPNDMRRWFTFPLPANDDVQGFGAGVSVLGSPSPTSQLWTPVEGAPYALAFTRVLIRPRIPTPARAVLFDAGLAGSTITPRMSSTTEPLLAGVTGVLKVGDTEPELDTPVMALAQMGDRIFVGGKFANVQRGSGAPLEAQSYLAAFDRATGAWIDTFRPKLDGTVWDMAVTADGKLLVAGQFTNVNGVPGTSALAALDPLTGQVITTWKVSIGIQCSGKPCPFRPLVRALDIDGPWLYLVGNFTKVTDKVKESTVSRIARVDIASASMDRVGFRPYIDGVPYEVDATAQRVYVVGKFTLVGPDMPRAKKHIASVVLTPATGAPVAGILPMVQTTTVVERQYQQAVLEVGTQVWQGGSEHNVHIYRRTDGALLRGFINARKGGDVQAIVVSGNTVFAGSHSDSHIFSDTTDYPNQSGFTRVDQSRWVSAFDATTRQHDRDFVLDARSEYGEGAWDLLPDSAGCLWVGGDFSGGSLVNGQRRYAGGFVKLCPKDAIAPSVPAGATDIPVGADHRLAWAPSTDNVAGPITYEIFRNDRIIASTTALTYTDLAPIGPARYFVRAVDAAGNRSATTSKMLGDRIAPTIPGSVVAVRRSADSIRIRWAASTDNIGVAGYRVVVDNVLVGSTTALTLDALSLAKGVHVVQIRAFDAAGNLSERSAPFSITL